MYKKGVRCVCRKCKARRTLAHHPDWYKRIPKCRSCGAVDYRPVVRRQENCHCAGYHFVHRKGSKMCAHHPEGFANRVRVQEGWTQDQVVEALMDCPGRKYANPPF